MTNTIYFGDNLPVLQSLPAESVDLIYIDPPFNTGHVQSRTQIKTEQNQNGDRTGFAGRRYETVKVGSQAYADVFDDYLAFLEPRLVEAHRLLKPDGSLFFHIDYREVHYCKILLDQIFGRASLLNEIIWAYDYGARTRKKWPAKHDNILWYAKDPAALYVSMSMILTASRTWRPAWWDLKKPRAASCPPIPGGIPLSPPIRKEKTGYPTQKPLGHSAPHYAGFFQSGRHGAGFFRRQRHHRRSLRGAGTPVYSGGCQSAGAGCDAQSALLTNLMWSGKMDRALSEGNSD